jgi:predicted nuclease of predicted toxin-antitoxin system
MLRLLSDENFNGDIVRGLFLRQPNLDLLRVQDVGLREVDDPAILDWAASNERILLTHDQLRWCRRQSRNYARLCLPAIN